MPLTMMACTGHRYLTLNSGTTLSPGYIILLPSRPTSWLIRLGRSSPETSVGTTWKLNWKKF